MMKKKLKYSGKQNQIEIPLTFNSNGNLTIFTKPEGQDKKEEKKQPPKKIINQPFPNLPSWNAIAIILSYYGPPDKVFELLHLLS